MRAAAATQPAGFEIRVRGTVQGVGFRPTVWRLASESGLDGEVYNDATGVSIRISGTRASVDRFVERLEAEAPPLSRIVDIDVQPLPDVPDVSGFHIVESKSGETRTEVTPDAAICASCREETLSPFERRFRYPFTNCTHCGPRFSIVTSVPYDRANTSMAHFTMCEACRSEYTNPADRRFHAQPIACHVCGPRAWLVRVGKGSVTFDMHSMLDDVDAVAGILQKGHIIAIRGLGGFHLACDAANERAVTKLRTRKHRDAKPFALMARDLDVIRQYCAVTETEAQLLESPAAPIVLLGAGGHALPDAVAPGLDTLGFMLPYTPLHLLALRRMDRPVVMTSANLSDAPQITANEDALEKLVGIADYALLHDRDIVNRIDDSVVRVMAGSSRVLRRARGYAPSGLPLPDGFEPRGELLAFGGELKSTFCLVKDGSLILSQHQGDLEDLETYEDYERNLALYEALYDHQPEVLVADKHPEYLSSKLARRRAREGGLSLLEVQHHHAHVAACMVENQVPRDSAPVLGVALDGLGFGDDGTFWGGEFLLARYDGYRRLGTFKPVPMIGGAKAIREPWRSLYAHLMAEMGWARFAMNFKDLELFEWLAEKPRAAIDKMLENDINTPLASSCGRLFDAVAACMGLSRDTAQYEAEGAMQLEAAVDRSALSATGDEAAYPFAIPNLRGSGLPYVEPLAMWQALLGDLRLGTPVPLMAARFHLGLARAIGNMVSLQAGRAEQSGHPFAQVALTGGCFQNAVLLELVSSELTERGFDVLTHSRVPTNDGGLALGQAAIAAALRSKQEGDACV
ncbi:MAG: carbamoyltransferase HypF [Myxococcota bacterium]